MDTEQATRALAALRRAAQHVQASKMLPSYARDAFTAAHQMIAWQAGQAARQALQIEALRIELQELRGKVGAPVMITNTTAGAVVERMDRGDWRLPVNQAQGEG